MGPVIDLSNAIPICITAGKSCYDITKGLAMNEDETFLTFYNRFIMQRRPQTSELTIHSRLDAIYVTDTITNVTSVIRLCRTLRVPEDHSIHAIPSTFGPLPLIDISKCAADNVPDTMKKKGGLIVPLLQREAMCITFGSPRSAYAARNLLGVRLYAGGVNVITGKKSIETQARQQDYYISPLQQRVDGFGGGDGKCVKQFVAMPLGTGYSVEAQLTGEELGGIQF